MHEEVLRKGRYTREGAGCRLWDLFSYDKAEDCDTNSYAVFSWQILCFESKLNFYTGVKKGHTSLERCSEWKHDQLSVKYLESKRSVEGKVIFGHCCCYQPLNTTFHSVIVKPINVYGPYLVMRNMKMIKYKEIKLYHLKHEFLKFWVFTFVDPIIMFRLIRGWLIY